MTANIPTPLIPALPAFCSSTSDGPIANTVDFCPGISLHASPELALQGTWRSPSGRVLELDIAASGPGDWIALHFRLAGVENLSNAWIGFACRHAGPDQHMIRPALRSGHQDGFSDCFFDKHILSMPAARNHLDAANLATTRAIPAIAPWRELVLFLPRPKPQQPLRWGLHDLRVFRL